MTNVEMDGNIFNAVRLNTVSSLSRAVRNGELDVISSLLASGKHSDLPDNRGWTPIHVSCHAKQLGALELMLNNNPGRAKYLVRLKTWKEETPLHIACQNDSVPLDLVKKLLDCGAKVNQRTLEGETALHFACQYLGNCSVVQLLVERGTDCNMREAINHYSPLLLALDNKVPDENLVKYLVTVTDPKIRNGHLQTPLLFACTRKSLQCVQIILEHDTSTINTSDDRLTPLNVCLKFDMPDIADLLLEYGADVNIFEFPDELPILQCITYSALFKKVLEATKESTLSKILLELQLEAIMTNPHCLTILFDHKFENLILTPPSEVKIFNNIWTCVYEDSTTAESNDFCINFFSSLKFYYHVNLDDFYIYIVGNLKSNLLLCLPWLYNLHRVGITSNDFTLVTAKESLYQLLANSSEMTEVPYGEKLLSLINSKVLSLQQLCRLKYRKMICNSPLSLTQKWQYVKSLCISGYIKDYILLEIL